MVKRIFVILFVLFLPLSIYCQDDFDVIVSARARLSTGNTIQAESGLTSAIVRKPSDLLYRERAEVRIRAGNLNGAIADLIASNSIVQYSGEYGLARVYAMQGNAVEAVRHLTSMMKSDHKRREKDIFLDVSFRRIESTPEWRQFWKTEWYTSLERSLSEAEMLIKSRRFQEAGTLIESLIREYPGNDRVMYAEALFQFNTGKLSDAVKNLSSLATERNDTATLGLLAKAQVKSQNYIGAADIYTRLINSDIPDVKLLLKRAECYMLSKRFDLADADLSRYLNFYPGERSALSLAGRNARESGDNLGALRYNNQNIEFNPGSAMVYNDRGDTYYVLKSWKLASDDYGMALDLDPAESEVWLRKGIALINSGDAASACYYLQKARTMGNSRANEYISRYCIK